MKKTVNPRIFLTCLLLITCKSYTAEQDTEENSVGYSHCQQEGNSTIVTYSINSTFNKNKLAYENQDSTSCRAIKDGIFFCGVFDGHGKTQSNHADLKLIMENEKFKQFPQNSGGFISDYASKEYPAILAKLLSSENISEGICIQAAHELNQKMKEDQGLKEIALNGGSTATMVVIDSASNVLTSINIGDSRTIVINNEGNCIFTTIDHTPQEETLEKPRLGIPQADGKPFAIGYDGRLINGLAVSRSFGDFRCEYDYAKEQYTDNFLDYGLICTPVVKTVPLKNGYIIVLASDGLWDTMGNKRVANFIKKNKKETLTLETIAKELAEMARFELSEDDITVQLIEYKEGQQTKPSTIRGGDRQYSPDITATSSITEPAPSSSTRRDRTYTAQDRYKENAELNETTFTWTDFGRYLIDEHKIALGVAATTAVGFTVAYYLKLNPAQRRRLQEAASSSKSFTMDLLSKYFTK